MIDAGRTFGRHPLWLRIAEGAVPRSALGPFAVQFFLQVREFPRAVSALHSSCPDARERVELAESLYEEETGRISGCNVSHPELFLRFGDGIGVPRDAMTNGAAFPATAALIGWFEHSTRTRSFIEGAAATNLAAEGQVPGAFGPFARALERHYGCSAEQVAFWDVHEPDTVRAMLADDVKLDLVAKLRKQGKSEVGEYYTAYAAAKQWAYAAGVVDGHPAMVVYDRNVSLETPAYFVALDFVDDRVVSVHDFLYARYAMDGIELSLLSPEP